MGLTVTGDRSRAAIDSIEEPPAAPMKLWQQLARRDTPLQGPLSQALHEAADGATSWVTLEERGITAFDGRYAAEGYAALEDENALHRWLDLTTDLQGPTALGFPWTLEDVESGPIAVLDAADVSPTIEIVLTPEWFDQHRHDRQERLLAWIVDVLAPAVDVRILGTAYAQRRLVTDHAGVLPASVTEAVSGRLSQPLGGGSPSDLDSRAEAALDALAWDHPAWNVLRAIDETEAERVPYSALYSDVRFSDVSESGVRKRVQRLAELGLVETLQVNGDRHVALLAPAGPALDRYREEYLADVPAPDPRSRAAGITAASGSEAETARGDRDVSDPPNDSAGAVCSRPRGSGGEDGRPAGEGEAAASGGRDRLPAPENGFLSLADHHAAGAAAGAGDVVLADEPAAPRDDPRSYSVSYDEGRDEVVVDVDADPDVVKMGVRLAAALVDDRLLGTVLTTDRLAGGPDRDGLDGLAESNPIVLRRGRHLGYLPKDGESANAFRSRLEEERRTLLKGLAALDDGDDFTAAASSLLKKAHGLIGTLTHVYDLLGVDLVRRISFPEYRRNFHSNAEGIATFIATAISIGSTFHSESNRGSGYYVPHRILYEDRPDKREYQLGTPQMGGGPDADPIGSWVLAGPGIDALEGPLRERLEAGPGDLQEDGEHFAPIGVDVDVAQAWRREAVAEVLSRLGRIKRLGPTRQATALLTALLGSLTDVARAVYALGAEDPGDRRDLELAELRYALSTLPPGRILPGTDSSTDSKIAHALLEAGEPLSKAGLAAAAGVSKESIANHRATLEGLGLLDVEETDAGEADAYRLRLPFRSERRSDDAPAPRFLVDEDGSSQWSLRDVLDEAVATIVGEHLIVGAPDLWQRLTDGGTGALEALVDRWPRFRPLVDVLAPLLGGEAGGRGRDWAGGPWRREARLGTAPPRRQASLDEAIEASGVG